jgi:hypothetical protein
MCWQAAQLEWEAQNLQVQGDKLAQLVVNQLDPMPLWYHQQEINQQEADHHKALQVVAEEAAAQKWQQQQLQQCQSQHYHHKQVHFLGVTEQ